MDSSSGFMKLSALDIAIKTSSFTRSGTPCADQIIVSGIKWLHKKNIERYVTICILNDKKETEYEERCILSVSKETLVLFSSCAFFSFSF
jgi:hypothetical protein